ncbi:hypothetical protein [Arthrobacter zhaoxinii]|uniref:hypothetical protein n=1 Tax=Arthrobacter zhaoxinii TaxID=2964616 RepID=UPI002105DCB5|nr:hypothetical protein [Arthrobacter zhaoxinii]MCQ2000559.1 hypothetical protein [Arthrobacter zhaoxinii]
MARVEWAALGGDEVEAVLSNLLYNDNPRAVRVRPSQGDYGIDVLVPHDSSTQVRDVYQIKKFATNLTANQKTQIESSFKRVLIGLVRKDVPLGNWYLAMPLNPTLENLQWFQGLPKEAIDDLFTDETTALTEDEQNRIITWWNDPDRIIEWKGLDYCESLVSKYWFVPDYYLHGGSERIRAAVSDVAKILQRDLQVTPASDSTSVLSPAEITGHLERLQGALDGDPHFRYGIALEPERLPLLVAPGLIAATQKTGADGSTITFKIYVRHAEALEQRPIPISLRMVFEEGSDEERAFEDWRKFGKPLSMANVVIDADLPGGLGGAMEGAAFIFQSSPEEFDMRYRIVAASGEVLSEISLAVSLTTGLDKTGAWSRGTDSSGFLTLETHADSSDATVPMSMSMSVGDLAGQDPTAVLSTVQFAANFSRPAILMGAPKYGPFHRAGEIQSSEAPYPMFVYRYIRALTIIQTLTPVPLTVPDLESVEKSDILDAIRAAALIEGKTFIHEWNELRMELDPEDALYVAEHDHYEFAVPQPLTINVGGQEIDLGTVELVMLSARLEAGDDGTLVARPHLNNTIHETFAPDTEPAPGLRLPVRSRPAATDERAT